MTRLFALALWAVCLPWAASASAWDMYQLCADRARSTQHVLDSAGASGWHPFGSGASQIGSPLDPTKPDELSIIATVVDHFFSNERSDAEIQSGLASYMDDPYTRFFTSGQSWAFARGAELFHVATEKGRRSCQYFGPTTPEDINFMQMPVEYRRTWDRHQFFRAAPLNAHFGLVIHGASARLKQFLNVDMPDQIFVETSLELIE